MQSGILVLHILVCLILIILILLQSGREGMGVIFGGGGNSSVFGSQGAGGILVKLTTFLAVMFIVTSLGYNILTANKKDVASVLDVQFEESAPAAAPAPVQVPEAQEEKAPAAEVVDQNAPKAEESAAPETAPAEEQKDETKTTGSITDKNANLVALNLKNSVTNAAKDKAKQESKKQVQKQKKQLVDDTKQKASPQKAAPAPKQQEQNEHPQMNYNEG